MLKLTISLCARMNEAHEVATVIYWLKSTSDAKTGSGDRSGHTLVIGGPPQPPNPPTAHQ